MKSFLSTVEILDEEEIVKLHQSTLTILESVGGRLPHPRVLTLFADAGAKVDFETGQVQLPSALVEQALQTVTKPDSSVEQHQIQGKTFFRQKSFKGYPGNEANIIDFGADFRRQGTQEDVLKGITLCNAMPYISSCMPLVTPCDVPDGMGDVYSVYLCALYSEKPFSVYLSDLHTAQTVLQMHKVLVQEPARMHDDSLVNFLLEPNASLSFSQESLEIALAFADASQRVSVGPMSMAGLDAPFSLAGSMVIQNAVNLLGVVLCHLLKIPASWSPVIHTIDPRSMMCSFGSPNHILLQIAGMQLGRHYGFQNFWLNLGLTDACLPDFQAGFEKGASAMAALLAGAAGLGAMGIVGADQATSLEQLVIDNEWASYLNHVFSLGFQVDEDSLALDLIQSVGIGGMYLGEEKTVRDVRKNYWKSSLFNQGNWDVWMQKGGKDIHTRAHDKVETILQQQYPPKLLLSTEGKKALENIIEAAHNQISSSDESLRMLKNTQEEIRK